jgi:hypothetical protein
METKIISVEYDVPGLSSGYCEYSSDQSLLDADIIVFRPQQFYTGTGKTSFGESESYDLQRNSEHWRRELLTALEYGKTVFLILAKYQVASIRTGKTDFKGRTVINYVADYDNYKFLPIPLPSMTAKSGTEMISTGDPVFAVFWKEFGKHLKYECYLNEKVQRPIFVTRTGQKPLGAVFKVEKGYLVLLPLLDYDEDEFLKEDKDGEYSWTKAAIIFGKRFVTAIQNIDKSLRSEAAETPPPAWMKHSDFISSQEAKLLGMIKDKEKEIQRLREEEQALNADLKKEQETKNLLFETGKPLEAAVIRALEILGYSAENYDDGELELDQVITSPEGERFIGECEGKDNSAINVDKFRQLAENIQADLRREDVEKPAIGILFANGFRLTAPIDRQEQFTQKCLFSAKRGTILVQTMDMYPVVRYILETKDQNYMKLCRDAILGSIGHLVQFPDPPTSRLTHPAPSVPT